MKENYKKGKLDGEVTYYYKNGKIEIEKNYINGKLEGKWISYSENGYKKLEENYKKNKLIKSYREDKGIYDCYNYAEEEKFREEMENTFDIQEFNYYANQHNNNLKDEFNNYDYYHNDDFN
jgi:antitoxin component YwqK of YwqJK toxin-antitoxin module